MIIYKTTNLINNKIYIGLDTKNDPLYLGSGKILKRAINKHNIVNFRKEILEVCDSLENLNAREIFWIDFYKSTNRDIGYNITKGGSGGDTISNNPNRSIIIEKFKSRKIKPCSNETRIKLSLINKGKQKSGEHRKKIADGLTGKKATEETKLKQSIAHTGLLVGTKNPMFGKLAWNSGKKMTDEFRTKLMGPRESVTGENNGRYIRLTDEQKGIIKDNYTKISKLKIRRMLMEITNLKISIPGLDSKIKELFTI